MTRPGERVREIASRLLRSETMERVIDPIVADLQCEYGEMRTRGRLWRARLGLLHGYFGLGRALLRLGAQHVCDPRTGNPGAGHARTWIVSVAVLSILTVALVIPPLMSWHWWQHGAAFGALVSLTLVPQALPLSLPAGLCVGVLWANRGTIATWRRLRPVLAIAVAFTVVVWVLLEWIVPEANQEFREMVAARLAADGRVLTLERGLNELGLSRLGQRTDPAAVYHYHVLWSLCFASIPLSLAAYGLAGYVRRPAPAVALATGLALAYMQCVWLSAALPSGLGVPSLVQAWLPNIGLLLVACAVLVRRRRPGTHAPHGT